MASRGPFLSSHPADLHPPRPQSVSAGAAFRGDVDAGNEPITELAESLGGRRGRERANHGAHWAWPTSLAASSRTEWAYSRHRAASSSNLWKRRRDTLKVKTRPQVGASDQKGKLMIIMIRHDGGGDFEGEDGPKLEKRR